MNTFVYLFSTLLFVGVAVGQTNGPTPTPSPDFDCPSGVPDGTTYPDPKDCKKYFVCTNGLAWSEECPGNLWYDPTIDQCNYPELVNCAASPAPASTTPGSGFTCPSLTPDDTYPNPEDCTTYYMCIGGVASLRECPDGLYFDIISKNCDWPDIATCAGNPNPSTVAPTTTTTGAPSSEAPGSSTVDTSSPATLEPSTDSPSSALPSSEQPGSSTAPPPPSSTPGGDFTCPPNGPDGATYPDPTDCAKYYVCTANQAIHEECPGGLWYDPEIQQCNWPEVVNCSANSVSSLFRKFKVRLQ